MDGTNNCFRLTTGGVQLQPFVSVGSRTEAAAAGLSLDHVTTVHVTVVAENAAGHRTVAQSQPLVLRPLPPRVCCVIVSECRFS